MLWSVKENNHMQYIRLQTNEWYFPNGGSGRKVNYLDFGGVLRVYTRG